MTVAELIERLKTKPQNAEVYLAPATLPVADYELHSRIKHWQKFDTVSHQTLSNDEEVVVLWNFIPG